MPKVDPDSFARLGTMMRPKNAPVQKEDAAPWEPKLNTIQRDVFYDETPNLLVWGEKGSGKSIVCCHKVVKHCYDNRNALAFIVTTVRSMQDDGGAWHKLLTEVLPVWSEGNRDKGGNLIDHGIGLMWGLGTDKQQNPFVWVINKYGSRSEIKGVSAPHPDMLRDRFPGREPSYVFVDELTKCLTADYYEAPSAQLGRRPKVETVQQFIGACNPDGPSHWVHKKWFGEPFNEETGEWDETFKQVRIPVSDNEHNLQEGYVERLKATYRANPVEAQRMVDGEWIDRPAGEALFRDLYNPLVHVRPLVEDGRPQPHPSLAIMPFKNYPLIVGLDPGSVHNAFLFVQWAPIDGRFRWLIFDEIVTIKKRIDYRDFIPMVMRRIRFWRERIDASPKELPQVWLSDNSAFNQYRAAGGSFDVLEIEKIYEANRGKYGLEPLGKVRPAPKFSGSQVTQVRLIQKHLGADEIMVSARCKKTNLMFLRQESKKQKRGEPFDPELSLTPRRGDHEHILKAFGYVVTTGALTPAYLQPHRSIDAQLISSHAAA